MAELKLPFTLIKPSANEPVVKTDAIDDASLHKNQSELNTEFHQASEKVKTLETDVATAKSKADTASSIAQSAKTSADSANTTITGINEQIQQHTQDILSKTEAVDPEGEFSDIEKAMLTKATENMGDLGGLRDEAKANTLVGAINKVAEGLGSANDSASKAESAAQIASNKLTVIQEQIDKMTTEEGVVIPEQVVLNVSENKAEIEALGSQVSDMSQRTLVVAVVSKNGGNYLSISIGQSSDGNTKAILGSAICGYAICGKS